MNLQLIASELQTTPDIFGSLKALFNLVDAVPEIKTEAEIDSLIQLEAKTASGLPGKLEAVSIKKIDTQFGIAKTYYDPNNFADNFI